MAMGADKSIHVEVDAKTYETMQPLHVAKILAKIADENKVDLILLGKQVGSLQYTDLLQLERENV